MTGTNLVSWISLSNTWHAVPTNEILRRAARGNSGAQCYMGLVYFQGLRGVATNVALSRAWLLKSADQNVALAQNALGWQAANGVGTETNLQEAVAWYQKAARQGFARAEANLGWCYRTGSGVGKDASEAVAWYQRAVEHGLAEVKGELGAVFFEDPALESRRTEGLRWLREAADGGNALAQNRLGWIYWQALGVQEDVDEARRLFLAAARKGSDLAMHNLYTLACQTKDRPTLTNLFEILLPFAEKGLAPAQYLVGNMLGGGLGVAQDNLKAIPYYEKAAAQDYRPALEILGAHYDSTGPHQDRGKALQYYQRAAAKGSARAKGRVAELILNAQAGPRDEPAGLALLQSAAEGGDLSAQYDLAKRYREGRGVATNVSAAIQWLSRAADRPRWAGTLQVWAAMDLGVLYATGAGVPRNDAEAVRWFKVAASFDAQDAQDSLGYCYATGRGVAQDDEAAVEWFREGAGLEPERQSRTYYPAVANLGILYALGRGGLPRDAQEAVKLLELAVRRPREPSCAVPHAQTALALCLYEGRGTGRDVPRAAALFREAADQGHAQAQLHFGVLCWRGEGVARNPVEAFLYLEAAARSHESGAAEWRDRVARDLNADQRNEAARRAQALSTAIPSCPGLTRRTTWNPGLRLPSLSFVTAGE